MLAGENWLGRTSPSSAKEPDYQQVSPTSLTKKAVVKEFEEQTTARGSQELTVGDIWAGQDI